MARPSRSLDLKLLATAREMLPETGFSGLSIREVARRAGVNVGMFHYHFKSKEAFHRRVVEEIYEDFLATFKEAAEGPGAPRERLRAVLVAFARFARDNRVFYTLLVRELLNAQPDMLAFAKANFPRHAAVLMGLLEDCRREGSILPLPAPMLAMFAMGTMGLPNIAVTAFERNGIKTVAEKPLKELTTALLSDAMIEVRVGMVLAGLAGGKEK